MIDGDAAAAVKGCKWQVSLWSSGLQLTSIDRVRSLGLPVLGGFKTIVEVDYTPRPQQ